MTLPELCGVFITFEGIDGSGKTTQAALLAAELGQRGLEVLKTHEPGGSPLGQELRHLLLALPEGAPTPRAELLLFLADRLQHLETRILPALERGQVVVCDRFHDSTVAFQHYGRRMDFSPVESLVAQWITPHGPQLTFWLDIDPQVASRRMMERMEDEELERLNRLEREDRSFHERVREGYRILHATASGRMVRLDATKSPAELAQDIVRELALRYQLPRLRKTG